MAHQRRNTTQQQPEASLPAPVALAKAVLASRSSGLLDLSGRELEEVPSAALNPDESLPGTGDGKWWEVSELTKADLSRNKLKRIEGIQQLTTLTHLNISSNELTELPAALGQLAHLRLVDTSRNPLVLLPDEIATLPALATLMATECKLRALPAALGGRQQPALAVISASDNRIGALPPGLHMDHAEEGRYGCGLRVLAAEAAEAAVAPPATPMRTCSGFVDAGQLVRLDLSKNCLQELDGITFKGLCSLVDCQLSSNAIASLPEEVGCLTRLQVLRLRENKLGGLPSGIGGCTSLVELHVGFNALRTLPPQLGACTKLQTLDVRNNRLAELPVELCALRLVLLDATNNDLRALPPQLGHMTTLRALVLDGNPLKLISRQLLSGKISALLAYLESRISDEEAGANGAAGHSAPSSGNVFGQDAIQLAAESVRKRGIGARAGRQELVLRSAGLLAVPPEVWAAGHELCKLDLSDNKQVGFVPPDGLASLPGLVVLLLSGMGLQHWPLPSATPPHPAALPQLAELSLRNNPLQLRQLAPHAFSACPNLVRLDLAGVSGAGSLPGGYIAPLQCLEVLDLSRTGCTALPSDVWHLSRLRILQLDDNSIAQLPDFATGLTKLEELHLRNNALSQLPPALGNLAPAPNGCGALRVLSVEGNMLRTVRRTVLEAGTPALLSYLADRIPIAQ